MEEKKINENPAEVVSRAASELGRWGIERIGLKATEGGSLALDISSLTKLEDKDVPYLVRTAGKAMIGLADLVEDKDKGVYQHSFSPEEMRFFSFLMNLMGGNGNK